MNKLKRNQQMKYFSKPNIIMRGKTLTFYILTISIFSFTGCGMFKSTQRPDLSPYAENIIKITGEIQYGLSESQVIYLRDYINGPKVELVRQYGDKARKMIRKIIAYSVEVVTLGHSKTKEKEKSKELAEFLDRLLRPMLEKPESKLDFTSAKLDTILNNVRNQKKFLGALSAAQPLIDNIAATLGEFLDEGKDVLEEALKEIYDNLMDDNRIVIKGNRNLRDAQIYTMLNIQYLRNYRLGDKSAIDSLIAKEPSVLEVTKDKNNLTSNDLRAIEERLFYKLKSLYEVRNQLSVDVELYNNQMRELDKQAKIYREALRKVRVVVIVWSVAHRKLAAGITDPATIDLVGLVVGAASKATR